MTTPHYEIVISTTKNLDHTELSYLPKVFDWIADDVIKAGEAPLTCPPRLAHLPQKTPPVECPMRSSSPVRFHRIWERVEVASGMGRGMITDSVSWRRKRRKRERIRNILGVLEIPAHLFDADMPLSFIDRCSLCDT